MCLNTPTRTNSAANNANSTAQVSNDTRHCFLVWASFSRALIFSLLTILVLTDRNRSCGRGPLIPTEERFTNFAHLMGRHTPNDHQCWSRQFFFRRKRTNAAPANLLLDTRGARDDDARQIVGKAGLHE